MEEKQKKGMPVSKKAKQNIFARIYSLIFGDSAREFAKGATLGAVKEFFKQIIVIIATCVASLVVAGVANFDWSFQSFDWFNKPNVVERANETIRTDAVWQIPIGMTVHVKDAGFVTFKSYKSYDQEAVLSYVTTAGKSFSNRIGAGEVLRAKDGCRELGFINMQTLNPKTILLRYVETEDKHCAAMQ